MRILLSLVFISFIASCTKTENEMTYIGGEVIHPLDSVVSISKDGELIKHIKIDSNNRFSDSIDIEEEGIYTFHHVQENGN